jgi:hypothetical protein
VVGLLVMTIFVGHVLNKSRMRHYAAAEETSHNLAIALENFLIRISGGRPGHAPRRP